MEINMWAVLLCAVVSMAIGAVWYGPLFGQKWMEVCRVNKGDLEARKKMQQEAMPLYVLQFLFTIFQVYVLAFLLQYIWELAQSGISPEMDALAVGRDLWFPMREVMLISLSVYAAFVLPTVAAASMWTAEPANMKWARFLIQGGYYLILFVVFGWILGSWN